ncbi:Hypothetical protein ERS075608_01358 [Mycobacteroides abscessus]|nr:Hypothetical protein ERS075608_01358 [Mycobacteroides abscessus]
MSAAAWFALAASLCINFWLIADSLRYHSENTTLRREIARLSEHPSTYEPEPLPYMRRYADDED